MTRKILGLLSASVFLALAAIGFAAQGKPAAGKPGAAHAAPAMIVWTSDQGEWIPIPGIAAKMKVVRADPGKAPTDLYIWQPAGTDTPLHWHSSDERIYTVSGDQVYRMWKGTFGAALHPGAFVLVPARMIHQARCMGKQDCTVLIHTTLPFDVNIVDENGKPIPSPKPAAKK
ncbi:MAG TPA: cupin domain-containing protein [Terriglobales bacterium]|nr:cupin domain-containing protein [Terriglobales bacterium]